MFEACNVHLVRLSNCLIFHWHRGGITRDQSVLSNLAQMFPDEDDIPTPRWSQIAFMKILKLSNTKQPNLLNRFPFPPWGPFPLRLIPYWLPPFIGRINSSLFLSWQKTFKNSIAAYLTYEPGLVQYELRPRDGIRLLVVATFGWLLDCGFIKIEAATFECSR